VAAAFYAHLVVTDMRAGGARSHLMDRFVSPRTLVGYGLGFAPPYSTKAGQQSLSQNLTAEGFSFEDQVASGLVVNGTSQSTTGGGGGGSGGTASSNLYDRFRNRIMVPIRRASDGVVVGFGGRALPEAGGTEKGPKYLNSPDSPVFKKGQLLYGLDAAKASAAQLGYTLLVEGYFDVISLHEVGVMNAVGVLGTAITRDQITLAAQNGKAKKVVLLMDEDAAGQAATRRACMQVFPTLPPTIEVHVATLKDAQESVDSGRGVTHAEQTGPELKDTSDLVCHFLRKSWNDGSRAKAKAAVQQVVASAVDWKYFILNGILEPALGGSSGGGGGGGGTARVSAPSFSAVVDEATDFIAVALANAPADRTLLCYYVAERLAVGRAGLRVQLETDLLKVVTEKVDTLSSSKRRTTGSWVVGADGKKVWTPDGGAGALRTPTWRDKTAQRVGRPVPESAGRASPSSPFSVSSSVLVADDDSGDIISGSGGGGGPSYKQNTGSKKRAGAGAAGQRTDTSFPLPWPPSPVDASLVDPATLFDQGFDLEALARNRGSRGWRATSAFRPGRRGGKGRWRGEDDALWENVPDIDDMASSLTSVPGTGTGTRTLSASASDGGPTSQAVTSRTAMSSMVAQRVADSEALLLASYVHLSGLRTDVLDALDGLAHAQGHAQGSMSRTDAATVPAAAASRRGKYVFHTPVYGRAWDTLVSMAATDVEGSGSGTYADVHALVHDANTTMIVAVLSDLFSGADLEHLQVTIFVPPAPRKYYNPNRPHTPILPPSSPLLSFPSLLAPLPRPPC